MRKSSILLSSPLSSLAFKYVVLVTFVLCGSLGFNLESKAQVTPPLKCIDLDTFQNTELTPFGTIEISTANPGPVNVLDDGSPGVLGDIRNITYGPLFNNSGFNTNNRLRIGSLEGGSIFNSNSVDGFSPFSILYNANGAGLNLDMSNTTSISLVLFDNDQPNTSLEFVITDSNNNSAQASIDNLPNRNQGDPRPADLDFIISEFSGIDGVDLTDIQSIEMRSAPSNFGSDLSLLGIEICSPETRDVPTLSEWGLIAMAGVLGIVSFMVMRRRKVAA